MRISVLQESLVKALGIVKGSVITRPTLPVLGNVLLASDNGRLKLTTTDLELSISVWVGAKVEMEGAITVPAKMFHDLVSNLSPERIDLELESRTQTLHLQSGGSKVQLKGISADEFPVIRQVKGTQIDMSGDTLRDMISEVLASVSKEDNRPVLTGIYTHFEGNTVTMASADGYRLTVRTTTLDFEVAEPLTLIIPARALKELAKVIGKKARKGKKYHYDTVVSIHADTTANSILLSVGDVEITSNLIEGIFPDYERIYPSTALTTTIVYREELLLACNKAKIFAKDSSDTSRLHMIPSADGGVGVMFVSAKSVENGEVSSMVDASIKGDEINAAYNIIYLIETLEAMKEDQVMIETIDYTEPVVIRAVGRPELRYIIMPMNVAQ